MTWFAPDASVTREWSKQTSGGPTAPAGRSGREATRSRAFRIAGTGDICIDLAFGSIWRVIITGCVWLFLATASPPNFAAAQTRDENSAFPAAQESVDSDAEIATDPQLKKNAVWLALLMWAGIIFGGVILLALVVMWGNRTRRLARTPLPPVAKRDELWFLKPKPPADEAAGTAPSDSDSNAGL